MALSAGTRLGPYEILAPIGSGGQGEVYKATDTRLGRLVALKVVPQRLSGNAKLRQRFEREARTISKLSHPHLCALYDIGKEDSVDFMVMEYLQGETLADRLSKGPLPLAEALRYAVEIADALHTAHGAGVVHRDLKPANIVITSAGAKLLDFGLAKGVRVDSPAEEASVFPTEDKPLTEEGAIVGTFTYMAPEQLEGKEADERTDLFAFGAVLYEMVSGKRAFSGKSKASLIAAIMNTEPPRLSVLEPVSPPSLDRVVERCLAKDPRKRWQTALDLREELDWIGAGVSSADGAAATKARRTSSVVVMAIAIAVAAIIAALFWIRSEVDLPRPAARFPLGFSVEGLDFSTVALSPDGHLVAFVRGGGLHVRALDELESRTLVQLTEGERLRSTARTIASPVFSPDSEWIAYWSPEGTLRKVAVAVTGGVPVTLCKIEFPRGLSWDVPETILFTQDSVGVLEVASGGGAPNVLVPLEGEYAAGPQQLRNGTLLFTRTSEYNDWDRAQVVVRSIRERDERILVDPGTNARVLPTGHIVFARGTTLFAARFDVRRLEVMGEPVPVIANIRSPLARALGLYSVSRAGSLIYVPAQAYSERKLVWIDRFGSVTPATDGSARYVDQPRLSPDGTRLAVSIESQETGYDIWIYDLERGTRSRLTHDGSNNHRPAWSPDGSRIAFHSSRGGISDIYSIASDGTGQPTQLLAREGAQYPDDWSPDGTFLTFQEPAGGNFTGRNIWKLPLDGVPEPVELTPFHDRIGRISPRGKWMAYVSDEGGRDEVYVREHVGAGRKITVSAEGGSDPVWARDGSELFYRSGSKMMVVAVRYEPFSVSNPRVLFETGSDIVASPWINTYDVAPNGERFLMIQELPRDEAAVLGSQPIVVLDWFSELERLVPNDD